MKLLALETSSAQGSVALSCDGVLREVSIETPREQTARILPIVAELLAAAGLSLAALDAIAFGRGPGSFTGLRIAAAVAQGLSLASARPLLAVSSLQALAQRAWREHAIERALVCVDARMSEVYWGCFEVEAGCAELRGTEQIGAATNVSAPATGPWSGVGDGFADPSLGRLTSRAERILVDLKPRARDLLTRAQADFGAGRFVAPEAALPVYLRDETAWKRH